MISGQYNRQTKQSSGLVRAVLEKETHHIDQGVIANWLNNTKYGRDLLSDIGSNRSLASYVAISLTRILRGSGESPIVVVPDRLQYNLDRVLGYARKYYKYCRKT